MLKSIQRVINSRCEMEGRPALYNTYLPVQHPQARSQISEAPVKSV